MTCLHALPPAAAGIPSPSRFPNPFDEAVHPLCRAVVRAEVERLAALPQMVGEGGKMFGILVVSRGDERGYLLAFSGTLGGQTRLEGFVPPVYDLMQPGCHFQEEQAAISDMNVEVEKLQGQWAAQQSDPQYAVNQLRAECDRFAEEVCQARERRNQLRQSLSPEELAQQEAAMIRESQHNKATLRRLRKSLSEAEQAERQHPIVQRLALLTAQRAQRSAQLQQWLFHQFSFLNARGEHQHLLQLFKESTPPGGAGECCAPRLLQYAYLHDLQPLCMAEFWVGAAPSGELRRQGECYPPCRSRCHPILRHMLQGLSVSPEANQPRSPVELRELYRDDEMLVISKPSGLLSVPGNDASWPSVYSLLRERYPDATGPLIVHRLDMDTSGLMVVALTEKAYHRLQDMFLHRRIRKTYLALLQHPMPEGAEGDISLPIRPDFDDRPRQLVDYEHGKQAHTTYKVLRNIDGHALVRLHPTTGRTHQLRVHCAHPDGLNNPIVGDRLYGVPAVRLMLHASQLVLDDKTFNDEPECKT